MRDIPLDAGASEKVAAAYELGGDTEAAEAFMAELAEAYGIPARSYRVTITEYSELPSAEEVGEGRCRQFHRAGRHALPICPF
jgi:hypothetical protein